MLQFIIFISKSGFVRLSKWYVPFEREEKLAIQKEVFQLVSRRKANDSSIIEFRGSKLLYRRYESVFFCFAVDSDDNELAWLEAMHHMIEVFDAYFFRVHMDHVKEIHLQYFFNKCYTLLDEMFLAGELQETGTTVVLDQVLALEDVV